MNVKIMLLRFQMEMRKMEDALETGGKFPPVVKW